ncbi:MAG TPA: response regulator [Anaerolineaceae bacterium]|nr:response regulator [Anaerolineaceae bacterium]HPN53408.1 response regulator [Anaerolineaceae bacterium]
MSETCRVLLVEDSPDQADLVRDVLALGGGYAVTWVDDLQGLWETLPGQTFDVILLDYRLPDGNGLDALTRIRCEGRNPPVIMVTGQDDMRVAVQTIQQGAADYIIKTDDYFLSLPAVIQRVVKAHALQLELDRSLEQIRYQALLLDLISDAVVAWDKTGCIRFWNPAAEALLGMKAADCLGQDVREVYFSRFNPAVTWPENGIFSNREEERRLHLAKKHVIWVSSRISPLKLGSREELGYLDVVRDISERKRMEAHLQRASQRLIEAARLAAVGELASGVAHRIYNPLTGIMANAQLVEAALPPESTEREAAGDIISAGRKAQEVVQQLLRFSRPASTSPEAMDINQTLQNALLLIGADLVSAGIQVELALGKDLPPVMGHERQIEDLWINLLLLSRDGSPKKIRINSGKVPGKRAWVEIVDDGRPIPAEQLESLFEPDFIGQKAPRGSGLEPGICRDIVRWHGGKISVVSDAQRTAFRIVLPVA